MSMISRLDLSPAARAVAARSKSTAYALSLLLGLAATATAADQAPQTRWQIAKDGGIVWEVAADDVHEDFIEMSGEQVALLLRYAVDPQRQFVVSHTLIWPMLRLLPKLPHQKLRARFGPDVGTDQDYRFSADAMPNISVRVGDEWLPVFHRTLRRVRHDGIARFGGTLGSERDGSKLAFSRAIFPSVDKPAVIDTTILTNIATEDVELAVDGAERKLSTRRERGVYGAYEITQRVIGADLHRLKPGESVSVTVVFEAHPEGEKPLALDIAAEETLRMNRVTELLGKLQLEAPDRTLETAFAFAKAHAAENIFRTQGGLLHSPGGFSYYATIWANDQAEYANPFFGMLGDPKASESAINAFRKFALFMNAEYRPIPSAIISEGDTFWNGAGDRGDMAMIAYGAARFALAYGNRQTAEELWPLIEWCLEYLKRKITAQGVAASDSDELEGRFPAGKANLSTSSLYYDALRSAVMLGGELKKDTAQLADYAARASAVRAAIERYFGANVEGFETYRYYDKADLAAHPRPEVAAYATRPDVLRAWIAMPLTMDLFDRKDGTVDALFSPRLWTADGLVSEAGKVTVWDRSTLYALRGVLAAGDTERGMERLTYYSNRRLLGDHVPYPFEASPEGGKAQLAAESALYCRVFTEGLFGLRPTGLRSFTVTPRLPDGWPAMALRNVHAFGSVFDLEVKRGGRNRLSVHIVPRGQPKKSYTLQSGSTANVTLH